MSWPWREELIYVRACVRTLVLFTLLLGCSGKPAEAPTWSVAGGFIRDPEGRAVILRGANVSGRHKEPPYFDFHGPAEYARMRGAWGMNSVRFLVSWAALEPERDRYDADYLAKVVTHVREATDAGLLVFVDMHQDLYGEGFRGGNGLPKWTCAQSRYDAYQPTTGPWFFNYLNPEIIACYDGFWASRNDLQPHLIEAWRRLAVALKDVDGFIGFDPMNEPYWGSLGFDIFEEKRLHPFYRNVIAAVRESKPSALAFIEPASSRNLGLASKLPRFEEPNLVYAPHAYDPDAESGLGFNPARREAIALNIAGLREEADALGAALVIGEYGGMANNPGISEYMDAVYSATGATRAGAMYWDFGMNDSYALLAADGGVKPALHEAVLRPYPERTAGTPGVFSFDTATRVFRYQWTAAASGTTLISVPEGTWPGGFSATCTGCTAELAAPGVKVTAAGAGECTLELK